MGSDRLSPLLSFFSAFPMLPSQVFLVRKVTRPDNGHLYAMKVLKKATLKGEWRAPPHAEPRLGKGSREAGQLSRALSLMKEIALSPGVPGLKVETQSWSQPPLTCPTHLMVKTGSIQKKRLPGLTAPPASKPSANDVAKGDCLEGGGGSVACLCWGPSDIRCQVGWARPLSAELLHNVRGV